VGAGAVALGIAFFIRLTFGGIFLPEIAVGALVTQTPGAVESVLVTNLQYIAKYSALTGAVVVNLALYGMLALLLGRESGRGPGDRFSIYAAAAYSVSLVISLVALFVT